MSNRQEPKRPRRTQKEQAKEAVPCNSPPTILYQYCSRNQSHSPCRQAEKSANTAAHSVSGNRGFPPRQPKDTPTYSADSHAFRNSEQGANNLSGWRACYGVRHSGLQATHGCCADARFPSNSLSSFTFLKAWRTRDSTQSHRKSADFSSSAIEFVVSSQSTPSGRAHCSGQVLQTR